MKTECPSKSGDLIHIGSHPKCGNNPAVFHHRPPTERERCESAANAERLGQIEQLESLLETLEQGDVETACEWVRAALKKLRGAMK